MQIPKVINKGEHVYIIEKEYPNLVLYKDMLTGIKECFQKSELIKIKTIKPTRNKWG